MAHQAVMNNEGGLRNICCLSVFIGATMSRGASSSALTSSHSYVLYRSSTLGETLKDSLQEMVDLDRIDSETALKILQEFDRVLQLGFSCNSGNC
jgi:hypothetical protein